MLGVKQRQQINKQLRSFSQPNTLKHIFAAIGKLGSDTRRVELAGLIDSLCDLVTVTLEMAGAFS